MEIDKHRRREGEIKKVGEIEREILKSDKNE